MNGRERLQPYIPADRLERLEHTLGRLLSAGVIMTTVLLAVGLGLWIVSGPRPPATGLLDAGLIVLMATPALRVVVSLSEFVRGRDWFFAATTFGVLAVLTVTLLVALWG